MVIRLPHDPEVPSSNSDKINTQLEIYSVYQAVIGTGFTWQCGGIAQVVELLI